jgi:uncharacterized RDD family membrane protein YckC
MKCQKCELELSGGVAICGHCGHNNAPQEADALRLTRPLTSGLPGRPEATLIPFPQSAPAVAAKAQTGEEPPRWRNQVKESVRLFREQRTSVEELIPIEPPETGPTPDSQHPIVEAALKRLQRPPRASAAQPKERVEPVIVREKPLLFGETSHREVDELPDPVPAQTVKRAPREPAVAPATTALPTPKIELHPPAMPQVSSGPQPASLTDRFLATLFDVAFIVVASVPLFAIHSVVGLQLAHGTLYSVLAILVWVTFVYQLWTMLVAKRTCGMAWRNLRVVDAETRELTFPEWRIFARSLTATVSLALFPLNILIIWSSGSQAGLADVLSQTAVCHFENRPPQPSPAKPPSR